MVRSCEDALLGVLVPPVKVFRMVGCSNDFWISLALIFIPFASTLYCFSIEGVKWKVNICCCFLPPLGIYLARNRCDSDVFISLVLMMFFLIPGIVWAYHKT